MIADRVAEAARDFWSRIVATLIRATGDWTLAEDCASEALAAALVRWPDEGVPGNPGGWLMTVARNKAVDALRRAAVERRKMAEMSLLSADSASAPDDQLRLIFTCCHPALALESRVALTLRTVAGVPTPDIARLFLVTETAMTRRLTRAKSKIAEAGIPYRVPAGPDLPERLPGVLTVLYLLFTRGYDPDGEPAFAGEAIRLTRLLHTLMPSSPEPAGLLALFLLQDSRRAARRDGTGDLIPLDRQDRGRWDREAIAEALKLLSRTSPGDPYALQARIAACHATAPSFADTDWTRIASLYDSLADVTPTPVIALNRAVAHGYAYGPGVGLALLAEARATGALDDYPAAVAAEADLTARAGDPRRAAVLFRTAAARSRSEVESRALLARAEILDTL